MSREINQAGLDLIKSFEGFKSKPYVDVAGKWTIGYGVHLYKDGTAVSKNDPPIDEATASDLLEDLINNEYIPQVLSVVKVNLTDNQLAATVSFTYNLGIGSLEQSTFLRCLNARNWEDAANSMLLWNKAGGIEQPGLTRRRAAEKALFLTP